MRVWIAGVGIVLAMLALVAGYRALRQDAHSAPARPAAASTLDAHPSLLYGRITTIDGATYEGRLRWGGGEEAFWGDYFNGAKRSNPWAAFVPPGRLPKEQDPFRIFGLQIASRERPIDLGRLFMARFGDIARVESIGRDVRVTLKSGTVFDLDRFGASDFDDGVRVWDRTRGVADLDSLRIGSIELLPTPRPGAAPDRLHGTVRTRHGRQFTGFLQWNREESLGWDELAGEGRGVRLDSIRAITRPSRGRTIATLLDGREVVLASREGERGVYVDDPRYGRVLVSWDACERVEFSRGGSGPAYGDFPKGGPLTGSITTRDGRRLTGRLVYDLDESEITETLDAPSEGVDYTIPLGLVAEVVLSSPALVTLHSGEQLRFDPSGDLGRANPGMLVFVDGQRPEFVPWTDIARIALDRPAAMYPAP